MLWTRLRRNIRRDTVGGIPSELSRCESHVLCENFQLSVFAGMCLIRGIRNGILINVSNGLSLET